MEFESLRLKKGDFLAAALVILTALALIAGLTLRAMGADRLTAQIYRDGELIRELPLDRDGSITIEGNYENEITVRDGRIAVTRSTCPGGDCVHTGWIGDAGRVIVCLPNRVEIRITGVGEIDAVVG